MLAPASLRIQGFREFMFKTNAIVTSIVKSALPEWSIAEQRAIAGNSTAG